jgi:hypothetical protein
MFDTDENGMGAAASDSGFAVFDVDGAGALWGYSFALGSDGTLSAVATQTQLGAGQSGQLGGAAIGDHVVVASLTSAMPAGTTLLALDPALDPTGAPVTDAIAASGETPIASNGSAMMIAELDAGGNAIVRFVTTDAVESDTATTIGSAAVAPYYEDALATTTGFALGYGTGMPSQRVQLATLDANLGIVAGPVTLDGGQDMYLPWFAYSPALDEFLVTWHQKDENDFDDTWAMLVDRGLNIVVPPFEVAPFSTNVVAAADADGFWLAYHTYMPASIMAASHVDAGGNVTARPVTSSGGSPENWTVVERDGQAILVWTETGGSGPNLYFDPFCN